jgi:hypothetical protein
MAYHDSTSNTGQSPTPSVAVPNGGGAAPLQADDIVILVCTIDNSAAAFDTADWPTGFTELAEAGVAAHDGQRAAVGWKRLTGADTGTYTFGSLGGGTPWFVCQAFAFRGRHTTNPPVVSSNATNTGANASPVTITANGVTAVTGDDLLWISAPDVDALNIGNGHTAPSTYTEAEDGEAGFSNLSGAYKNNVAAGATGTVSGTFALTSGAADWIAWLVRIPAAASGAIAGTIDLAITPSGTLTGTGALAGTVALAVTPTGALTGTGALAGAIALSLTPTGALTGAGALAGDIPMTIAPTGTLTGTGALAGSISLAFDIAGAFEAGQMLGDIPLALTVSGALSGAGALAGSVPLTLTPAGALTGTGALAGTVPLAFDLTGELTGTAAGDIAGSVSLSIDVTGALTGSGALVGAVTLTVNVTGALARLGADDDDGFADEWAKAHQRRKQRREAEEQRRRDLLLQQQQQRDEEMAVILLMLA